MTYHSTIGLVGYDLGCGAVVVQWLCGGNLVEVLLIAVTTSNLGSSKVMIRCLTGEEPALEVFSLQI